MSAPIDDIAHATALAVHAAEEDVQRTLRNLGTELMDLSAKVHALEAEALINLGRQARFATEQAAIAEDLRSAVKQVNAAMRKVASSPRRDTMATLSGAFLGSAVVAIAFRLAEHFHLIP